ncbi:hypothetical protein D3C72_2495560 [compost metagenome]
MLRAGSFSKVPRMRTKAMVVDAPRSPLSLSWVANADSGGIGRGATLLMRAGI